MPFSLQLTGGGWMNVMTTFVQALEKSLKQDLVVQEDYCEMFCSSCSSQKPE